MKLACADDTFRLLEHERILELVRLLGLDGVDICLMEARSSLRLEDVRADVAGSAARVGEHVRGRGLEVADVFVIPWTDFRTLAPNHPDPAERAASYALFEDVLDFATRLGSPGITILPGIDWETETPEASLERASLASVSVQRLRTSKVSRTASACATWRSYCAASVSRSHWAQLGSEFSTSRLIVTGSRWQPSRHWPTPTGRSSHEDRAACRRHAG